MQPQMQVFVEQLAVVVVIVVDGPFEVEIWVWIWVWAMVGCAAQSRCFAGSLSGCGGGRMDEWLLGFVERGVLRV